MSKFRIRKSGHQFFVEENVGGDEYKIVKISYSESSAKKELTEVEQAQTMIDELEKKIQSEKNKELNR